MKLGFSDRDLNTLFMHFDPDNTRQIEYNEFIWAGLAPPMSERRESLVMQAFRKLDVDGSGTIEPSEVVSKFNADSHPEVWINHPHC